MEIRWYCKVTQFSEFRTFTDRQIRGPFRKWEQRHDFESLDTHRTRLTNTITYGAASGVFGRFAENLIVGQQLDSLFEHRRHPCFA